VNTLAEEWRELPGSDNTYQVSSFGRVYSHKKKKFVGSYLTPSGYHRTTLGKKARNGNGGIHVFIARAYLGPRPSEHTVNHINGIKTDNRPQNLEYVTSAENTRHAWRTGLIKRRQLYWDEICCIRALASPPVSRDLVQDLADYFGVSPDSIKSIIYWRCNRDPYPDDHVDPSPRMTGYKLPEALIARGAA